MVNFQSIIEVANYLSSICSFHTKKAYMKIEFYYKPYVSSAFCLLLLPRICRLDGS